MQIFNLGLKIEAISQGNFYAKNPLTHNSFFCILNPPQSEFLSDGYMIEIVWHRRETRRQTERTNINLC